jgi:anti-repressor protein
MSDLRIFDVEGRGWRFGQDPDGRPWAVAADVARSFGQRDADRVTRLLDEDEKSTRVVGTPGGPQEMKVIFEDGIWELIFRSTKPEAKEIKRRVKAILREIRETGSYSQPAFEVPKTLPDALRAYAAEVEAREAAERRAAALEPDAEAWHILASAEPDYSVREAAYILNRDPAIDTGQNRLFNELRRMRVIDSRDIPYADHARHVKLRARSFTNRATGEETPAKPQVRITAEGLAYLHKKLGGTEPLRLDEMAGGA